jgi:nitrate reductase alpha subunit
MRQRGSAGARFLSMIGGTILSFYDWYADMPIASPQVFEDQTDPAEPGTRGRKWRKIGVPY